MFGFKLVRQSKLDQEDLLVFRSITDELFKHCNQFIEHLDEFKVDSNAVRCLENYYHLLANLVQLYMENKYSSNMNVINFHMEMEKLERAVISLKMNLLAYERTVTKTNEVGNYLNDNQNEEELDQLQQEFDKFCQYANNMFVPLINEIIDRILHIRAGVSKDIIRILAGVDIIREYHTKVKMNGTNGMMFRIMFSNQPRKEADTRE